MEDIDPVENEIKKISQEIGKVAFKDGYDSWDANISTGVSDEALSMATQAKSSVLQKGFDKGLTLGLITGFHEQIEWIARNFSLTDAKSDNFSDDVLRALDLVNSDDKTQEFFSKRKKEFLEKFMNDIESLNFNDINWT